MKEKFYRDYDTLRGLINNYQLDIFGHLGNVGWFLKWLRSNMHIFNEFIRYSNYLRYEGKREHYSARAITQRMRWDTLFQEEDSCFKISDHSTPYMSRLVMYLYPDLDGMFRIKSR